MRLKSIIFKLSCLSLKNASSSRVFSVSNTLFAAIYIKIRVGRVGRVGEGSGRYVPFLSYAVLFSFSLFFASTAACLRDDISPCPLLPSSLLLFLSSNASLLLLSSCVLLRRRVSDVLGALFGER